MNSAAGPPGVVALESGRDPPLVAASDTARIRTGFWILNGFDGGPCDGWMLG